jgi:hypothetical protein
MRKHFTSHAKLKNIKFFISDVIYLICFRWRLSTVYNLNYTQIGERWVKVEEELQMELREQNGGTALFYKAGSVIGLGGS